MKILHLGDLHLGKKLCEYSLEDDQKFVLKQALELVCAEKIEVVLISGDVFDRAVPPVFALDLFSNFLEELSKMRVLVFIIAGNHDSPERLSYLSSLVENSGVFISKTFDGTIRSVPLASDIEIFLMPYLYPAVIRNFFPDAEISNYNDAIKLVLDNTQADETKTNIILAHQFVLPQDPVFSESEQKSAGGIDAISPEVFEKFDYVALGHLHCPQKAGPDKIRYSGSVLKYSFSEINQKKVFTVLNVNKKGEIDFEFFEIKFKRDLREFKGYFSEFADENFYSKIKTDDFIRFVLFDEVQPDVKRRLGTIFPFIASLEFENSFTKNNNSDFSSKAASKKTIQEHFSDFYFAQCADPLEGRRKEIVCSIAQEIEEKNDSKESGAKLCDP